MRRYAWFLLAIPLAFFAAIVVHGAIKRDAEIDAQLARICEGLDPSTAVGRLPDTADELLRLEVESYGDVEHQECAPSGCAITCSAGSCSTSCKPGHMAVCVCKSSGGPICSCLPCTG